MRTFSRSAAILGCAIAIAGVASPAFAGVDPELNHTSYWEQNGLYSCTKVELGDGTTTATVPSGAAFIVVKAGTEVTQVWPGIYGGGVYDGTKDISFIITCWPVYHS